MNIITLQKTVPAHAHLAYSDMGWKSLQQTVTDNGLLDMQKTISSRSVGQHSELIGCDNTAPKLVPGVIQRPLGIFDRCTLESAVDLSSYSSSQDFSMACVQASYLLYRTYKTNISAVVDGKTFLLRVYGLFDSQQQYSTYTEALRDIFRNKPLTLPGVRPGRAETNAKSHDFWWDVANHRFLSFDKNFMSRMDTLVKNTFCERHNLHHFDSASFI